MGKSVEGMLMNQKFFLLVLMFTLFLTGCQQKTSSSKSSSSNNSTSCTGQAYWTTPGCAGYCQYYPASTLCGGSGGTTGTTSGGTTGTSSGGTTGICAQNPGAAYCSSTYCAVTPKPYGCLSNGTNCYLTPTAAGCGGSSTTVAQNPYWGMWYPPSNTEPVGSCSSTYIPTGLTGAVETRKGTITLRGKGRNSTDPVTDYSPFDVEASSYQNTSSMLMSVAQAKMFFLTDSVLKLRVKVKPEPNATGSYGTSGVCYGRNTGAYLPGYTKLQYTVKVYGTSSSNAVTYLGTVGTYQTSVNNCSPAIDLSDYKEQSPTGLIVVIDNVMENKNCTKPAGASDSFWNQYGWSSCNTYNKVRSMECWSMDFEVAADGTKTFD